MSKGKKSVTKIDDLTFEQSIARLEEIVGIMGSNQGNLEEMVALYEEGMKLKELCSKKLDDAKMKIDVLMDKEG